MTTTSKSLVISGDDVFLKRYAPFINALGARVNKVEQVAVPTIWKSWKYVLSKVSTGFPVLKYLRFNKAHDINKASWIFDYKSNQVDKKVKEIKPDFALHIFCLSRPVCSSKGIPFGMSLDYTMLLAERQFKSWAHFPSSQERDEWIEKEKQAYQDAKFLFPWSKIVAKSLIDDYGVDPKKVVVTGSSGNLKGVNENKKAFGSKALLFNGSEFDRKGGYIVLEAFKRLRAGNPQITLNIVGINDGPAADGVTYPGHISAEEMNKLFTKSDLVLGPALCDPFPGFIIEAMGNGIPCIVSNNDGMPEIVDDKVNGIVLEELDADKLFTAINGLLNNTTLLEQYSEKAKQKVREKLNWDSVADIIINTIK